MQKNTVFESPEQEDLLKKARDADVSAQEPNINKAPSDTLPSIEFLPYVDEVEEKRRFWKTVLITILVFMAFSFTIIGYVLTQRLSQPSKPKINIQYIEGSPRADVTIKIQVTKMPTRGPRASSTPLPLTPLAQISRAPTKKPDGNIPYVIIKTGTPAAIPIRVSTLAPTSTTAPGQPSPTTNPYMTPLPTVTPTSAGPTPTPYLYSTSDGTSGVSFGYVEPGTSVSSVIQLMNLGGSSLTISELTFATTGGTNPYVLSGGGDGSCLTSINLPYTLPVGVSKCVSIHFNPTLTTTNTNSLLIRWNTLNIKTIPLSGNSTTPTPTRTPTPTS